jgi:drug/metabolite transporter (DMT)-like permease
MAIWGSTFVVTKAVLEEAEPFFVVVARLAIALVVLWPLLAWQRNDLSTMSFRPVFVALGLLGVVGNFGLQTLGLVYTGAADAALIIALTPLPIAVLAAVFLREQLGARQLTGIAVSIVGVVLITGLGAEAGAAAILGDLLILASTFSWAGYTLLTRRIAATYSAATITTAGIGWGLAFLLPLAVVEAVAVSPPELSPLGIGAVTYLGVAASAATFLLWNYALKSIAASVAGTFLNLIPAFGLVFALLAGESLSSIQLAGGAAVALGVWLGASRQSHVR